MNYDLSFGYVWDYRNALLAGLSTTAYFAVSGIVVGILTGALVALARMSGNRFLAALGAVYVEVFRGTPLLVLLFWIYFALPIIFGTQIDSTTAAITSLSLFMGALSAECFRSAIMTIGKEQVDACDALGLEAGARWLLVVLPQALLFSIPTVLSCCIVVFKESALISAIGITDLMYQGRAIAETTARPIEILTVVAGIYFVFAFLGSKAASGIERRILRYMSI